MKRATKTIIAASGLSLALIFSGSAFAQTASESMHAAGESTENAISHAYHGTKTAVKDTTITAKVKTALHDDKLTKDTDIHVKTVTGVVRLSGTVPSSEVSSHAEQVARNTTGVKGVENELKVTSNAQE